MTSSERTEKIDNISHDLLSLLRRRGAPCGARELLRDFRKEGGDVDQILAELALSQLLNQRLIDTDREMRLFAREELANAG